MTAKLILICFFLSLIGCQRNTTASDEEIIFRILTHFEKTYLHNLTKSSQPDYLVFMNSNYHGVTHIDGAYDEFRINENDYQIDSVYSYDYNQYLIGTFQFLKSDIPENLQLSKPLESATTFCNNSKKSILICPLTPLKTPFGMEMEVLILNNQKDTYLNCRMTYSNLHQRVTNMEFYSYEISNLRQYHHSELLQDLLNSYERGKCFFVEELQEQELDLDLTP